MRDTRVCPRARIAPPFPSLSDRKGTHARIAAVCLGRAARSRGGTSRMLDETALGCGSRQLTLPPAMRHVTPPPDVRPDEAPFELAPPVEAEPLALQHFVAYSHAS